MKYLKHALLLLGITILIIFISTFKIEDLSVITQSSLKIIIVLIGLTIVNIIVKSLRWILLINNIAKEKISLWFAFKSIIAGVSAGSIFPGRVDLAKPIMLKNKKGVQLRKSISALFIERILDLSGLIIILLVSLALIDQNIVSKKLALAVSIILILLQLIFFIYPKKLLSITKKIISFIPLPKKIFNLIDLLTTHLFESFHNIKDKKKIIGFFSLSILAHLIEIFRIYLLLGLLLSPVSFLAVCFVFCAGILLGLISLIPGGMGVTEWSSSHILFLLGASSAQIASTSILLDRIFSYYSLVLIGGLILLLQGDLKSQKILNNVRRR